MCILFVEMTYKVSSGALNLFLLTHDDVLGSKESH